MSAAAVGQTMFSGLCAAVRPVTDPYGAQVSSADRSGPQSLRQEAVL